MATRTFRQLGCLLAGVMLCGALAAGEVYRVAQAAGAPASSARAGDAQRGGMEDECTARWRAYSRSQACFARFRAVHGLKPDAFKVCGPEVLDPSVDCGARR